MTTLGLLTMAAGVLLIWWAIGGSPLTTFESEQKAAATDTGGSSPGPQA